MTIKIEMLRCFCAVVHAGNLSEAANRLGRTQSAVSMTLKQLQDHLGERLFETERKNRLSPVGEQVFELAQKQLQQFDYTVHAIETSAASPHGLIRIVSVPSIAAHVFPTAIETITRRHPGVMIELRDTDTQQVMDAMAQGHADIGIASGQFSLNGVRSTLLFEDRFGLVCSADHPMIHSPIPPTIAEVTSDRYIHNNLCGLIQTPAFQAAVAGAEVTVHNTHSLIAMVRSGNWVTILPKTVVQFMPDALAFRAISDLSDKRHVYLYLRDQSRDIKLAEELCDLIVADLGATN
ncbi:putative hydrogen peroxide-inducible genes activator [Roseovarius albus]|uniref:Putative hydrogen peroxide-inducible genes activator n=1 Tax=Roseovarius albus TaxID=1247867 RepID=A0A1X6Z5L3_9RHOB|nr:LysR family transcriptional regulator [Roseovarius albus]SLN41624.1 putative hydrogen peroxide-inducible genes activator [Roseovarius albus]